MIEIIMICVLLAAVAIAFSGRLLRDKPEYDNALAIAYFREHYMRIYHQSRSKFDYDRVTYRAWIETRLSLEKHHRKHPHYTELIEFVRQMIELNKPFQLKETA